jgi:hypothetical protein
MMELFYIVVGIRVGFCRLFYSNCAGWAGRWYEILVARLMYLYVILVNRMTTYPTTFWLIGAIIYLAK